MDVLNTILLPSFFSATLKHTRAIAEKCCGKNLMKCAKSTGLITRQLLRLLHSESL